MRRFELIDEKSRKYWEIDVRGTDVFVHFGRIDSKGQSKTKSFTSKEEAKAESDILVNEKLKKGYVEIAALNAQTTASELAASKEVPKGRSNQLSVSPVAKSELRSFASEASQITLRHSTRSEVVFTLLGNTVIISADQRRFVQNLDTKEDAHNHLTRMIMLRGKEGYEVAEKRLIDSALVLAPDVLDTEEFDGKIDFESDRLLVTFEEVASLSVCQAILGRIGGQNPRSVQVICDPESPGNAWSESINGLNFPSITGFIFDTHFQSESRQSSNSLGDLAYTFNAYPNLQKLFATGHLSLSSISHSAIQELYFVGDPLPKDFLKSLENCEFPKLQRLAISMASDAESDDKVLCCMLQNLNAPHLKEVFLGGLNNVPYFLELLAKNGISKSWQRLSLAGSDFEVDHVLPILRKHGAHLKTLSSLELSFEPGEDISALQEVLPVLQMAHDYYEVFSPKVYESW